MIYRGRMDGRKGLCFGKLKGMETSRKLRQKSLVWAGFVRVNVPRLSKVIGKQLIKIQELGNRKH